MLRIPSLNAVRLRFVGRRSGLVSLVAGVEGKLDFLERGFVILQLWLENHVSLRPKFSLFFVFYAINVSSRFG